MLVRTFPSLLLGAALAMPAAAQNASPPAAGFITLDTLYSALRTANPAVAAAEARAQAMRARVPGAGVPADPQIQLGWMNYMIPSLAPMSTLGMTQLQVMQMLPVAGQLGLSAAAANAAAAAESARAEEAWWVIRARIADLYYALYEVEGRLGVTRETLLLLEEIRRGAEAMYRVGTGRQTDVLRAHVEIARMTEDTLRMRAEAQALVARVNALLDRRPETPLGIPLRPDLPEVVPPLDALIERAATSRPVLIAAASDLDAADLMARLARREIYPDLQVGVQVGQRGDERMGSLMVGASLPIFARRRQFQAREEADAMRAMAVADHAMARAETFGALGVVRADLDRSRRLQQLYRTSILPQAEAAVTSALAAYRGGQVDFMTLLESRMVVNAFRQELVALEAAEGSAWAELEMLTGTALTSTGTSR